METGFGRWIVTHPDGGTEVDVLLHILDCTYMSEDPSPRGIGQTDTLPV